MDELRRKQLLKLLKGIQIGCFVLAAKFYAESRYYQGRIDASLEIQDAIETVYDEFNKRYNLGDEEA